MPIALFIAVASSFFALAGCQQAQPPVNRVQANAVDKQIFLGSEWYGLRTVIDTPYTSPASFVGEAGDLNRIEWDIQEKYLIARRTHQQIRDSEDDAVAGAGVNQSPLVAMYAIESHFDIRREYNPTTGEELNVVVENTTDRVWYERAYMRVDWSKNLVAEETFPLTSSLYGIELEPLEYYVQEPDHPFAPKFERDEEGRIYYIDIVNKYFAEPGMVAVSGGGELPSCFFLTGAHHDCQPGEIAVRSSFLRVDPARDYQPMIYDYDRMQRFGYFLTVRDGYDPDYGTTAMRRFRFVNRHNLWMQSHRRDAEGELLACSENADCGGGGSVCDLARQAARSDDIAACTIPFREREVRPIAFHLTRAFPEDLVKDARSVADTWNEAFVRTVGSLRQIECRNAGGEEGECEAEREREDAKRIFVLCGNPVAADDHEACGPEGTSPEIGDIRYNLISWVGDPHDFSPLGYGPSFADPETGEIISCNANVYGAAMEKAAARARDVLALINDDLPEETLSSNYAFGVWIDRFAEAGELKASEFEAQNHLIEVDGRHAARINRSMDFSWIPELLGPDASPAGVPAPEQLLPRLDAARDRLLSGMERLRPGDRVRANLSRLEGTDIEQMLIDDEVLLAAGYRPGTPLSEPVIRAASPLGAGSASGFRERERLRRQTASKPNGCLLYGDFVDDGLLGLVREINRAARQGDGTVRWYGRDYRVTDDSGAIDYALVKDMLRHPIFFSLTTHELGHTLGLRHNFAGSFDSLNYGPEYWRARDDGDMQPRAWDPVSQAEIDARIREHQYASVMDYGHNHVVTDAAGIGHYDRAAIKLGYGDLVEVFTEVPSRNRVQAAELYARQLENIVAFDTSWLVLDTLRLIPYTEIPALMGGVGALQAREDVPFTTLVDGTHPDPAYALGVLTSTPDGRPAVPYRYCSEEFVDEEPSCMRYDAGADEYESLMSIIDSYWNYYIFNNFMRQEIGFDPYDVPGKIYSRYFLKLQAANTYYTFLRALFYQIGADELFFERPDGFGAYTAAVGAAYQLLSRVIATPDSGCHLPYQIGEGETALLSGGSYGECASAGGAYIDAFDGRELYTTIALGPDQSFWYYTRAGFFNDKTLALEALTTPGVYVRGADVDADTRSYQVNFYNSFPEPLFSLLRGIIGQDWSCYAPRWSGEQLLFADARQQVDRSLEGIPVDPNVRFSLQLYAMVFGMAGAPSGFDQSFVDRARLFVRGGAESVELALPEDAILIEFVDHDSGLVYLAPSYPDEEGRETGIAAQMLLHALELQEQGQEVQLHYWMDNLNIMRRLTWLLGFGSDLSLVYD